MPESTTTTPPENRPNPSELICGVDKALIERFLILIRDNYKRGDKATFFLEERRGIQNTAGIANMRDVLSHLATALDPDISEEDRWAQLTSAEEHLRRAIIEPYEISVRELLAQFDDLYRNYKELVLPIKDKHTILHSAPNAISVDASLREIQELTAKARFAKGGNIWNENWEAGAESFITAYDKLSALYTELEGFQYKYEQIVKDEKQAERDAELKAAYDKLATQSKEIQDLTQNLERVSRKHTRLHIWAIIIAIVAFLIPVMLTIINPHWDDSIRESLKSFFNRPPSNSQPK